MTTTNRIDQVRARYNLLLVILALIITFSLISCGGEASTSDTTSTSTPTATQDQRLGGLHLDGYCNSQGFGKSTLSNGTWVCTSNNKQIDLTGACQWQYSSATNVTVKQERAGDPYSWACYGQQSPQSGTPSSGAPSSKADGGASDPPSEADARQVYENRGWGPQKEPRSSIEKVLSFKKTNGQMRELQGVKVYALDYEAEVECLQSRGDPRIVPKDENCIKGETRTRKGTLEFQQTEKGWKGPDGKVY